MPRTGTLGQVHASILTNSYNAATVITIHKNGVDTAITMTVPTGVAETYSDTTNTVDFAAGDSLTIEFDSSASASGVVAGLSVTMLYE